MHVHTEYSRDAYITTKELVYYSRQRGLDGVAITDHDTVDGLHEFAKIEDLLVIPGLEIETKQGHVLALNVTTLIEKGLSFAETIDQIHDAGGLAIVAHPVAFFKSVEEKEINNSFDGIEVVNASAVPFSFSTRKSRRIAKALNLPQTGGSDAHYAPEVGMAYTIVDCEADVDDVVRAIRAGSTTPFGTAIPWSMRLKREFLILQRTMHLKKVSLERQKNRL